MILVKDNASDDAEYDTDDSIDEDADENTDDVDKILMMQMKILMMQIEILMMLIRMVLLVTLHSWSSYLCQELVSLALKMDLFSII